MKIKTLYIYVALILCALFGFLFLMKSNLLIENMDESLSSSQDNDSILNNFGQIAKNFSDNVQNKMSHLIKTVTDTGSSSHEEHLKQHDENNKQIMNSSKTRDEVSKEIQNLHEILNQKINSPPHGPE